MPGQSAPGNGKSARGPAPPAPGTPGAWIPGPPETGAPPERTGEDLAQALDRVRDGIFTLDREWRYTYLNSAGAALAGHTVDELLGRRISEVFPSAVGSNFERRSREAAETGQPVEFEEYFEALGAWFAIRVFPSPAGLTVYYLDVTERRRAQDELAARARQQHVVADLSLHALAEQNPGEVFRDTVAAVARTLDAAAVELRLHGDGVVACAPESGSVEPTTGAEAARMVVPLPRAGGEPLGTLSVRPKPGQLIERDAMAFLDSVASLLANRIERDRQEREARYAALHDPLTDLPNRRLLFDLLDLMLDQGRAADAAVVLLVLSIERLDLINNSFGHAAGDELLAAVAERMRRFLPAGDVLARPAGDLYAVAVRSSDDDPSGTRLAAELQWALSEPFSLRTGEHFITTRIGIAVARGHASPEALLRDAETALQQAARCPGRVAVFDDASRRAVVRRLDLDRQLHRAVDRGEFDVVYQPIVDVATGELVGAEALARWRHPTRGLLLPEEFIAAAEENGMIIPIGTSMLESACRQAAAWQERLDRPFQISVNLSARQLADPAFAALVTRATDEAGLLSGTLGLEITETVLMEESQSARSVLAELRALGVRLLLDDFGTGFSSMSYFKRLPVDSLKIDKSFVREVTPGSRDAAIVEAVVRMAHAVDMSVVAEGVQTEEQHALLKALGCDRAQGYLFARPLPPQEFDALLSPERS